MAKLGKKTSSKAGKNDKAESKKSTGSNMVGALKEVAKAWKKTSPIVAGKPLSAGDYVFKIDSATIEVSKGSGRLQVNWALSVASPQESVGRKHYRYSSLADEKGIGWLKGDLEILGIEAPESIEELGGALEQAEGLFVLSRVKDDDFGSTRFMELVDESEVENAGEKEDASEESSEDEGAVKVGMKVTWEDDGETKKGTIIKIIDDDTVKVKDDDDNVTKMKIEDLSEDEEEGEESSEEESKDESEEGSDEETITEEDIKKMSRKELKALIKDNELDIDPEDYPKDEKLKAAIIKLIS